MQQGDIASDRADAIARYLGKQYDASESAGVALAPQPGRSSVVSRDVSDVVEGVLANVLKPFVSGDRVVQFDPRGPEDEEQAEQETDYINFVALERNNGFLTLNTAVKDALLLRAGYIKCAWTKRSDVVMETYYGYTDLELTALLQDKGVELVGRSDSQIQANDGTVLHDVKVRRVRPTEFVETMPTPPDEILVSQRVRTPSVQDADFVQHRTMQTLSELRQAGYDVPDDIGSDDDGETLEDYTRQRFGQNSTLNEDETQDPARRLVLFKETWLRIDRDGDGIAELRRVCVVGETILADEEADIIPIAAFCPTLMQHQHLGVSIYDQIKDLAEVKTALIRQYLDNKYLTNNPRTYANMDAEVNLDDLMTSRPGGVIRGKGPGQNALMPILTPDTGSSALEAMEYFDTIRENRTGYTKAAEGMRSSSLATDTLGELQQQVSQSGMRLEMISRTIAETGVRDLFRIVHALTLKHSTREEKVRLRNKWVLVNPREWVRRTDLSISVGLGSTSQQQMTQSLMMLGQAQQQAMALGLVTPDKVFNLLGKLTNSLGFKNAEEFFTAPQEEPVMDQNGQPVMGEDGKPKMQSKPPQTPPDPIVQAAQIKAQADGQTAQIKAQADSQVAQAKAQMEAQLEQQRMQAAAQREHDQMSADMQTEMQKAELTKQLELAKAEMQLRLDDLKHQRDQQTAIEVANIQANASIMVAEINAGAKMKAAAMAPKPQPGGGARQ